MNASNPASARQMEYLMDLIQKRADVEGLEISPEVVDWLDNTTKENASRRIDLAIEALKKARKEQAAASFTVAAAAKAGPVDGFYSYAGEIFKIVYSDTGNPYAKRLVEAGTGSGYFQYAPGEVPTLLKSGVKLSLEEAKKYGKLYGYCVCCGRTLTNEESIEAGMGKVCQSKF